MVELRRRPSAQSETVRRDFCNEIKKLAEPTMHTARSQHLPAASRVGSANYQNSARRFDTAGESGAGRIAKNETVGADPGMVPEKFEHGMRLLREPLKMLGHSRPMS